MKKVCFTTIVLTVLLFTFTSTRAQSDLSPAATATVEHIDNDLLVCWKEEGASYRVLYNRSGEWVNTLVSYDAAQLPKWVNHKVRSAYPQFRILFVEEMRFPAQPTVYRLQLEDTGSLVILQVSEEGMAVEKKIQKD